MSSGEWAELAKPLASVVWLNHNSMGIIDTALESLQGVFDLDYPELELIIVDNGSNDGSFKIVKEFAERKKPRNVRLKIVKLERNLGFAGGVNRGYLARDKDSRYLVLLNNDAVPFPQSLSSMVEVLETHESLGGIQGVVVKYDSPNRIDTAGDFISEIITPHVAFRGLDPSSVKNAFFVTYPDGAYSVYKIRALERALGRSDRLFYDFTYAYLDDVYLGLKLWNAGYRSASIPLLTAKHARSATFGKIKPVQLYLSIRFRMALNEMANSRWRGLIIAHQLGWILLKAPSSMKALALSAVMAGKRMGKVLKAMGESIDLYKAPIIELDFGDAMMSLLHGRRFREYLVPNMLSKLTEERFRFDF